MILITTAGNVGSEAARLLVERHVPVRVLVRDSGKAKALADAGAQIAVGDLEVPESIDEAAHASAIERIYAEHAGVGAGDRQDEQLRHAFALFKVIQGRALFLDFPTPWGVGKEASSREVRSGEVSIKGCG